MPSSVQQSSARTAWPGIGSGEQVLHMGAGLEHLDGESGGGGFKEAPHLAEQSEGKQAVHKSPDTSEGIKSRNCSLSMRRRGNSPRK